MICHTALFTNTQSTSVHASLRTSVAAALLRSQREEAQIVGLLVLNLADGTDPQAIYMLFMYFIYIPVRACSREGTARCMLTSPAALCAVFGADTLDAFNPL